MKQMPNHQWTGCDKCIEIFKIGISIFFINLYRRKKIGILATSKWGSSCPKFNSPELKTELKEFCTEIASECAIPEINFNEEGIANHVKTFFSEQRRYKKNKSPSTKVCVTFLKMYGMTFSVKRH